MERLGIVRGDRIILLQDCAQTDYASIPKGTSGSVIGVKRKAADSDSVSLVVRFENDYGLRTVAPEIVTKDDVDVPPANEAPAPEYNNNNSRATRLSRLSRKLFFLHPINT
jgi:hypothetical protein